MHEVWRRGVERFGQGNDVRGGGELEVRKTFERPPALRVVLGVVVLVAGVHPREHGHQWRRHLEASGGDGLGEGTSLVHQGEHGAGEHLLEFTLQRSVAQGRRAEVERVQVVGQVHLGLLEGLLEEDELPGAPGGERHPGVEQRLERRGVALELGELGGRQGFAHHHRLELAAVGDGLHGFEGQVASGVGWVSGLTAPADDVAGAGEDEPGAQGAPERTEGGRPRFRSLLGGHGRSEHPQFASGLSAQERIGARNGCGAARASVGATPVPLSINKL